MQQGTPEQQNDEIASGVERTPVHLEQQQQRAQEPQRIGEVSSSVERMRFLSEQEQREKANNALQEVQQQPPTIPCFHLEDLTVEEALNYVDDVKDTYIDQPDVYKQFIDMVMQYRYRNWDVPGVLARIRQLFNGNPQLIDGFNKFLPLDYEQSM